MITINVTGFLTDFTAGRSELKIDSEPETVREALERLWDLHVGLRDRVVNERGELRQHVNIFLDNENIRRKQLLDTKISNESEITILPSVSGGQEAGAGGRRQEQEAGAGGRRQEQEEGSFNDMKAIWNNATLAESEKTIVIEGNHYFPPDSANRQYFQDSATHSTCPWKGKASYYNVVVDGEVNKDAAWYYPEPKSAAEQITDYVAFWKGVKVEE